MSTPSPCRRPLLGLALVGLLLTHGPVLAQSGVLQGTVQDDAGAPLPGVNVVLEGDLRGAATDAEGRYWIPNVPPGTYTAAASAIGFRRQAQAVTVTAGGVATADFVLEAITLQSGEVVVTASRRAQLSGSAPVSLSTVTPRALEVRNVTALDEALRYVPGVQLADNQVSVRGSSGFSFNTGSRILLLVDGMPMLRPDADGIAFDALPMAQVARIEVLKGPGSALYGSGALGGVIHVLTKDFPAVPETSLRLFGGIYEPVRYAAWRASWDGAGAPRPLYGLHASHARRFSEQLGAWVSLDYRDDKGHLHLNKSRTFQGFGKLGWRPQPALRVDLLGGVTVRTSDTFLYWNGLGDPLQPGSLDLGTSTATGTDDSRTVEFSILPSFTHVLRPTLFYQVKGRLFGVVIQPLDDDLRPRPLDDGTVGFRYGGEAQLDYAPRAGTYLTTGLSADANATRSSFFDEAGGEAVVRSQPEAAAFAQAEQQLTSRLRLTAGLRFDSYRIRAGAAVRAWSPKLNLALAVSPQVSLRAAYGQGFRVPSVTERYVSNRDFLPVISNLDLRPEESTGYELGLHSLLPLPFGAGAQLDAALFWNDYRSLIEPVFVAAERAFQFVNLTRARIRGLETTLSAATSGERASLQIGYTLLDADDRSTGQPLVFRSRHLFKAALDGRIFGPLEAGLDFRLASRPERIDSDYARFVPDADAMVSARVLDVRLGGRWRGFRAALLVKNALEYYYVERPAILAPTRRFILQVQVDF